MPSHKTLALLALAASTASPALSAPLMEGQKEARASAAVPGIGNIVKTVASGVGFGALPVVLGDVLGGNSSRRDLPAHIVVDGLPVPLNNGDSSTSNTTPAQIIVDGLPAPLNSRGVVDSLLNAVKTSGSVGSVIGNGLLGGVASGVGAVGATELLNNSRREPSPLSAADLSGIGKTILGAGTSLVAADAVKNLLDPSSRDLSEVLQLVRRHLDERGAVSSLLNAVKTSDSIGSVIGNGLLGGVASGVGAIGATELLNNTRRDDNVHGVGNGLPPQFSARDLISALDIVARQLAELD